jgi:phospholipid/cholesterol/gamma-HCH transport system substrate-binding protein
MDTYTRDRRVHPLWWTAGLFSVILGVASICSMTFAGTFRSFVPVTLTSDRIGLVMDTGAKVKMRGVQVGTVGTITGGRFPARLQLQVDPKQMKYIPANVAAEIKATTAFGAKYVDLVYPEHPSPLRLTAGAVLSSRNVSTEVNTVFQNLMGLLNQIDVSKLNGVLTALADGVRGQGERMGEATTDANKVLLAINPRMDTITADWRAFKGFSDAYAPAAQDILSTLDAASTTSATITHHRKDLDDLLLGTIGFANSGTNLLGRSKDNLIHAVNSLAPTADLLLEYNPEYTCTLQGAKNFLDDGGLAVAGGNGRTLLVDTALLPGGDPYTYPENLSTVAAKGGPGGKPGCGSLPDVSKNFPVRYMATNTGWGTGLDQRPNPGLGHPCYADYFPVTRAMPKPPKIRQCIPGPAIGPVPYPGAPPYGAPLYGRDGTPLYPGVPPAPAQANPPAPPAAPTP